MVERSTATPCDSAATPHGSNELGRRRLLAADLFAAGLPARDVARRLRISRATAWRWSRTWTREGPAGLESMGKGGRQPRLDPEQLRAVERALLNGPLAHGYPSDLWTLERISHVIRKTTGVHYHPGHVWRLLHRLGWTREKPAAAGGREAAGRWVKRGAGVSAPRP